MVTCGCLLKSALVALLLVVAVQSGSSAEKLVTCCTRVSTVEITEEIIGFLVQARRLPCVQAVIFQTKSGLFCSHLNAPWVRRKIIALRKAKSQATPSVATSSPVSLLSIITSTASPSSSTSLPPSSSSLTPSSSSLPPSSSSLSSFPSTSEMPDETSSDWDKEKAAPSPPPIDGNKY